MDKVYTKFTSGNREIYEEYDNVTGERRYLTKEELKDIVIIEHYNAITGDVALSEKILNSGELSSFKRGYDNLPTNIKLKVLTHLPLLSLIPEEGLKVGELHLRSDGCLTIGGHYTKGDNSFNYPTGKKRIFGITSWNDANVREAGVILGIVKQEQELVALWLSLSDDYAKNITSELLNKRYNALKSIYDYKWFAHVHESKLKITSSLSLYRRVLKKKAIEDL